MEEMNTTAIAGGEAGAAVTEPDSDREGQEVKKITLTEDELAKKLESEADRRVNEALKSARNKWQEEQKKALEKAKSEAERLAKMTVEQKQEALKKKAEEDMAKREAEITRRELRAEAMDTLITKNLPKGLVDTLDLSSAEACTKSMDTLEKCFKEAVEAAVNDRLRSDPPKTGTASKSDPFLKGFLGQ